MTTFREQLVCVIRSNVRKEAYANEGDRPHGVLLSALAVRQIIQEADVLAVVACAEWGHDMDIDDSKCDRCGRTSEEIATEEEEDERARDNDEDDDEDSGEEKAP